jgi:hypothetical protein
MHRLSGLLDPESAATIRGFFDQLTSPRRGGPRFVADAEKERAQTIIDDPRTTDQIMHDGFVDAIRIANETAPDTMLGRTRHSVRILITHYAVNTRTGYGRIEGQPDPVSFETVERHLCDTGTLPIAFDADGQCINVGREHRLFTRRQREGLATRDGGCLWPHCERPPSWTEAHHINQWQRDAGLTNLADGVLLCRHHHMLLHDNHWEINRAGADYWLIPPPAQDPRQKRRRLESKSASLHDLLAEADRKRLNREHQSATCDISTSGSAARDRHTG